MAVARSLAGVDTGIHLGEKKQDISHKVHSFDITKKFIYRTTSAYLVTGFPPKIEDKTFRQKENSISHIQDGFLFARM